MPSGVHTSARQERKCDSSLFIKAVNIALHVLSVTLLVLILTGHNSLFCAQWTVLFADSPLLSPHVQLSAHIYLFLGNVKAESL